MYIYSSLVKQLTNTEGLFIAVCISFNAGFTMSFFKIVINLLIRLEVELILSIG